MVPSSVVFDGREGIVGVFVTRSRTVLQFRRRIENCSRRLCLFVRVGLELGCMTPGTSRLVCRIPIVWRPGNHLIVADVTHGTSGAAGVRLISSAGMCIDFGWRPRRCRMTLFA